jgi:hypothetical protein
MAWQTARQAIALARKSRYAVDRKSPELDELYKKMSVAQRRGDSTEVKALRATLAEVQKKADEAAWKKFRMEHPELDPQVLDDFEKVLEAESKRFSLDEDVAVLDADEGERSANRKADPTWLPLAPRIGTLPLNPDGTPATPNRREAYPSFIHEGLAVSVPFFSATDPAFALPAFVDWMCAEGCVDIKYGIDAPGLGPDEE